MTDNDDDYAANDDDYYGGQVCPEAWLGCIIILSGLLVFLASTVVCIISIRGW